MVMAGNEDTSGSMVENSTSSRLQWLKQRRLALQDKLIEKNSELKNLCIEEAELTGILPPEIPLEPGESPPLFRRRAATSYLTELNTFNKFNQNGTEESSLELERQVQVGIMENSLSIINDSNESKSMRRKHRQIYQQTQKRLQELDARLNFVRQSHGKSNRQMVPHSQYLISSAKHRMKKPRPPLNGNEEDHIGMDNFNIIGMERKSKNYNICDDQTKTNTHQLNASPMSQHKSMKPVEYDHNENHNIYILPDQQSRIRTYSHGSNNTLQNHYRTHPVEEQKIPHYSQKLPYTAYNKYHTEDASKSKFHYDKELCTLYSTYSPEYQVHCKSHLSSPICHRGNPDIITSNTNTKYKPTPDESQLLNNYWIRSNDDDVGFSQTDQQQIASDRFGSLDRRRQNNIPYNVSPNTDIHNRYHTVAIGSSNNKTNRVQPTIGHHLCFPLTEQTSSTNNRMLSRTQSLGSVESWHVNPPHDSYDHNGTTSTTKSSKEKHWYETSLDYDLAVVQKTDSASSIVHNNNHNKTVFHQHKLEESQIIRKPVEQQNHYSRIELNIPQEIEEEKIQTIESSNNCCTIIQAGKYQPYREVTKPFEMSDFYKYSTKFRKKLPTNGQQGGSMESIQGLKINTVDHNGGGGGYVNPTQNRLHQPVQKITCQPYLNGLR